MEWKEHKIENEEYDVDYEKISFFRKPAFLVGVGILFLLILFVTSVTYSLMVKPPVIVDYGSNQRASTTPVNSFINNSTSSSTPINEFGNENLRAEKLFFGDFYKKVEVDFEPNFKDYSLPINVKTDAANYHEISRVVNLDPYVEDLNENGFALLNNDLKTRGSNFYKAYEEISKNNIPLVVTNDFLFYYYQNILKKTFRDIEESVFYDNLWLINKDLYELALARYRERLGKVDFENDPLLEAERMEAAYFAVALKLLQPTKDQINVNDNLKDDTKFTPREAEVYSNFNIPDFLRKGQTVEKEVSLIRDHKEKNAKSNVMLYYRDYTDFVVPKEYINNARLNNFYLAVRWMNSVFPLYFSGGTCEDCLLDENDWRINMAAAAFISKDISSSQEIKNKWAIIYKFISFFKGLRRDLTYLHYDQVFGEVFGDGYDIEEIFSPDNLNYVNNLGVIRGKLANIEFLNMEGGMKRNTEMRPDVGMRILQEYYWPNNYIFSNLTGEELQAGNAASAKAITSCGDKDKGSYRCKGFGLDIVKLLYDDDINFKYYNQNTDYENYYNVMGDLKNQINLFDNYAWNNNVYWVNLDIARSVFSYENINKPVFAKSDEWLLDRDFNTVLGGWANLHLPEVSIISHQSEVAKSSFGDNTDCDHSCVELNIDFIQELIDKNKMLIDAISGFGVVKNTSIVSTQLNDLDSEFKRIRDIAIKEVSGQKFDEEDCGYLKTFTRRHVVKTDGDKTIALNNNSSIVKQNINGTKMMILVYTNADGKKVLAIGPIFNYSEGENKK